jgi:hypothetical protein
VNLKALHVFRPVESLLDIRALVGLAVSMGVAAAAWYLRRHPFAAVGFELGLLPLLPALYIPAIGEGAFFERYLYLPVLGFAILVTLGARAVIERWPWTEAGVTALLILLVLAYAVGSVSRNRCVEGQPQPLAGHRPQGAGQRRCARVPLLCSV